MEWLFRNLVCQLALVFLQKDVPKTIHYVSNEEMQIFTPDKIPTMRKPVIRIEITYIDKGEEE